MAGVEWIREKQQEIKLERSGEGILHRDSKAIGRIKDSYFDEKPLKYFGQGSDIIWFKFSTVQYNYYIENWLRGPTQKHRQREGYCISLGKIWWHCEAHTNSGLYLWDLIFFLSFKIAWPELSITCSYSNPTWSKIWFQVCGAESK